MKIYSIKTILFLTLQASVLFAQDIVSFSNESISLYNPSYIFQKDKFTQADKFGAVFGFQRYLYGFDDVPETFYTVIDFPYYAAKGYWGMYALGDGIGSYKDIHIGIDYTYPYTDFIALGIRGGVLVKSLNKEKLVFADATDPLNIDVTKLAPDLGVGIFMNFEAINLKVNASVLHLTEPDVSLTEAFTEKLKRFYWLNSQLKFGKWNILFWGHKQFDFYQFAFGAELDWNPIKPMLLINDSERLIAGLSILVGSLGLEMQYKGDLRNEIVNLGNTLEFVISFHERGSFTGIPCPR